MNKEYWVKWNQDKNLAKKYYIESIIDIIYSFEIILFEYYKNDRKIKIIFNKGIEAYRVTDETYRHQSFVNVNEKSKQAFFGEWTFFKIKNSSYIKSLNTEDIKSFMHFVIITEDPIVDIISSYEPIIEIIK